MSYNSWFKGGFKKKIKEGSNHILRVESLKLTGSFKYVSEPCWLSHLDREYSIVTFLGLFPQGNSREDHSFNIVLGGWSLFCQHSEKDWGIGIQYNSLHAPVFGRVPQPSTGSESLSRSPVFARVGKTSCPAALNGGGSLGIWLLLRPSMLLGFPHCKFIILFSEVCYVIYPSSVCLPASKSSLLLPPLLFFLFWWVCTFKIKFLYGCFSGFLWRKKSRCIYSIYHL